MFNESAHLNVLRLEALLWRVLGPRVQLDSERLNRLIVATADTMYSAGLRYLPAESPDTIAERIAAELYPAVCRSPEFDPVPRDVLRVRTTVTAGILAARGFRKIV